MAPEVCQSIRDDLVSCLLKSDCVVRSGKTPLDCIRHRDELPLECQHLITAYADCRKGMLDMSRRFRGNHLSNKEKTRSSADSSMGIVNAGPSD